MAPYVLEGPKWGAGVAGTASGAVTWSFAAANYPNQFVEWNGPAFQAAEQQAIRAAFARWESVCNIDFVEVADSAGSNLRLGWDPVDGPQKIAALCSYTFSGSTFTQATIQFDTAETWNLYSTTAGISLYTVALHEIGHALGLDHFDAAPSIMNSITGSVTDLTPGDIEGARAIYGPATNTGVPTTFDYSTSTVSVEIHAVSGGSVLRGGSANDILFGADGADSLNGGLGADRMSGGRGNDSYFVDDKGDLVIEAADGGLDRVVSTISYALSAHVESLQLLTRANLDGTGNDLANYIGGNDGNNRLDGGLGADTLVGGRGNDRYVVDDAGDKVVEKVGEGADGVVSSVTYTLAAHVETLQLVSSGSIDATGNELANWIGGNGGRNTIDGRGGADMLFGGGGDDIFILRAGEAGGDLVGDFTGARHAGGDTLLLTGYGADATFARIGASDSYLIRSHDGAISDTIRVAGVFDLSTNGSSDDVLFV